MNNRSRVCSVPYSAAFADADRNGTVSAWLALVAGWRCLLLRLNILAVGRRTRRAGSPIACAVATTTPLITVASLRIFLLFVAVAGCGDAAMTLQDITTRLFRYLLRSRLQRYGADVGKTIHKFY